MFVNKRCNDQQNQMDPLQDKLLTLQLLDNKVKELPGRLMNCLKFKMDFDKDSSKDKLPKMRKQIAEMDSQLKSFLAQSEDIKIMKEEIIRVSEGNRCFFDQLMANYGISETELVEYIGHPPAENDDLPVDTARSSEAGESLPEDDVEDEELSYELKKPSMVQ